MKSGCVEYFLCVEYRVSSRQLCIRNCNNTELERLLRRRRLEEVLDIYAKQAIVRLIELELLRRGRISEAALIRAVMDESPVTGIAVYSNTTSLLVTVKTFFTADCLLSD